MKHAALEEGKGKDGKASYTLEGWPAKGPNKNDAELVPLPFSNLVRQWCQAGKKVRVTFEVVEETADVAAE